MPDNNPKTLFIASDHGGFALKEFIKANLADGTLLKDLGTGSEESVDYPDFAHLLAGQVAAHPGTSGILICGTG
ncbi:MAG TPA: RpiB/LacA/LacB family sugar-phosphate isomerase, partial [Desulfarculaceae bacterium]|nr:RpiB/LacA/LacB family sugar-phosphate isomerase [Desulfarculaceae bacterium]